MTASSIETVGEFVELKAGDDVISSSRYNEDIAPTRVDQRTWKTRHIASLWVGMAICVPTYTLGGVLTAYFWTFRRRSTVGNFSGECDRVDSPGVKCLSGY